MYKKKKRPITLLEIMIVILIIGLIGGVLGYNMKGSLDRGKAFKTEQGIARLQEAVALEEETNPRFSPQAFQASPQGFIDHCGLFKDSEAALKDGWGGSYVIGVTENGEVVFTSQRWSAYKATKEGNLTRSLNEAAKNAPAQPKK